MLTYRKSCVRLRILVTVGSGPLLILLPLKTLEKLLRIRLPRGLNWMKRTLVIT
uniref:Uncharacterized protein n=1 Tax=uncultured marine virus TaxID=186617 RepID=A0A0F7L5T7_9VIRU|nr:hypothetical protein [uncultured marine virus]